MVAEYGGSLFNQVAAVFARQKFLLGAESFCDSIYLQFDLGDPEALPRSSMRTEGLI